MKNEEAANASLICRSQSRPAESPPRPGRSAPPARGRSSAATRPPAASAIDSAGRASAHHPSSCSSRIRSASALACRMTIPPVAVARLRGRIGRRQAVPLRGTRRNVSEGRNGNPRSDPNAARAPARAPALAVPPGARHDQRPLPYAWGTQHRTAHTGRSRQPDRGAHHPRQLLCRGTRLPCRLPHPARARQTADRTAAQPLFLSRSGRTAPILPAVVSQLRPRKRGANPAKDPVPWARAIVRIY